MKATEGLPGLVWRAVRAISLAVVSVTMVACGETGPTGPSGGGIIVITPSTMTLYVSGTQGLTARAVDSNGQMLSPQPAMTWSSGAGNIASVDGATGRVTALAVGTTTITASGGGMSGDASLTVIIKPVASVILSPALVTIAPNTPTAIRATLRAADGEVLTGRPCTWTSSDAAVLSVTSAGGEEATVTGLTPGTVTVTATCDGQRGTAMITVRLVPVASIVITPNPAVVEVAKTLQLSAVVKDAQGNPLTRTVTWNSAEPGTATVNTTTGLLTGVSPGTVEISATADGFTTRITVTVNPKPVARISVNPMALEISVGQAATFTATAYAADGEVLRRGFFTWSVSSTAPLGPNMILSGSQRQDAQVFGAAEGSTTLTASLEGVSASATLNVRAATAPVTVSLSPASGVIDVGRTGRFTATVTGTTNTAVTWSSSNTAVASVDRTTGLLSALSVGTTTITATSVADPTKFATAQLRVQAPTPSDGASTLLTSGVPLSGRSGGENSQTFYRVVVPSGATRLEVRTSGGTGDLDLYVRRGSNPTPTQADCRSERSDNNEVCVITNPAADTWFILAFGFRAYSGVTIVATVTGGGTVTPPGSSIFAGGWRRYGNANGYQTDMKVGGIPGQPANRVYLCTLPPTPNPQLIKGTLQADGATIRWDAVYGVPDYEMRSSGSNTMQLYVPSLGAVGGSYERGTWRPGSCGLSL